MWDPITMDERLGAALDRTSPANQPTRFLIVTAGRTGSSWLMEMLNSHPVIGGYGELLTPVPNTAFPQTRAAQYADPGGVPHFAALIAERKGPSRLAMPLLGVRYLDRLYARPGGFQAIGFRLLYGHLKTTWRTPLPVASWLLPYAALRRVRILHLVRRNKLELIVSKQVGNARRLLHARRDDDVPPARVHLDVGSLRGMLDRELSRERFARMLLHATSAPFLEVSYEDLLADTQAEFRRVVEFLEVMPSDHAPDWRMRKLINSPLEETIENYGDVARTLRGTRHAAFL
jgi:LPS sulfotransferase NodH